jgi:NNP family nitrate/nitrite transporter-like MFS transporter
MPELAQWEPEDNQFWDSQGKRIANRNLWISIPNLLLGFSVWIYWGMVAKYIQQIHFSAAGDTKFFDFTFMNDGKPFDDGSYKALLYLLPAVAGLTGATLRIPNSFMVAICGGRNVKFMTTLLLMLPALGAGIALQDHTTPFWVFIILAALSGVGGGAFASSMSNISFFFPKKLQGLALGLNAGIGNLGVSLMQFLIPYVITFTVFGSLSGDGYPIAGGETMYIANAGLVWVPILAFFAILAFFMMHNLPFHKCGATPVAAAKYLWLTLLGFGGAAAGIFLLIFTFQSEGVWLKLVWAFAAVAVAVPVTLLGMRYLTPKQTRANLQDQFGIFQEKHNWVMTYLYVMTFGSFIGYASAFPKLIGDVFVSDTSDIKTANYIWIGAGVGALIRPVGGWLSDKLGGALVTQWSTIIMIGATVGAGYFTSLAMDSDKPEQYFMPFLLLFILLFAMTGIGNGSTFRMIGVIFARDKRGPVLGWTSAIAAYGAFMIPMVFGIQIKAGTPQYALYGFAGYYLTCLIVNWWFYARKGAEIRC